MLLTSGGCRSWLLHNFPWRKAVIESSIFTGTVLKFSALDTRALESVQSILGKFKLAPAIDVRLEPIREGFVYPLSHELTARSHRERPALRLKQLALLMLSEMRLCAAACLMREECGRESVSQSC
jgi:hypothetical protein